MTSKRERSAETGVSHSNVNAFVGRFIDLFCFRVLSTSFVRFFFFRSCVGRALHASQRTAAQHRNNTLRAEGSCELRDRLNPTEHEIRASVGAEKGDKVALLTALPRGREGHPKQQYCSKMLVHRWVLFPADSLTCETSHVRSLDYVRSSTAAVRGPRCSTYEIYSLLYAHSIF